MKFNIIKAKNLDDMDKISEVFYENKFKLNRREENYILMKKRRYGYWLIHIVALVIALFAFWPLIFVNVIYFTYSYIWNSPFVLITTEIYDNEGKPLIFTNIEEVLSKANSTL